MKKLLCVLLCILITAGLLPLQVWAEEETQVEAPGPLVAEMPEAEAEELVEDVICAQAQDAISFQPLASEWTVVKLVNIEREKLGLDPLTAFGAIQEAAGARAGELATLLDHTRPDGTKFYTVLKEYGVSYNETAENIAWGYSSANSAMRGWVNSAGHYKSMTSEKYRHIGVGRNGSYWVQLFVGHRKDSYLNYFDVIVREASYPCGTTIEEMDMYAIMQSKQYGTCYLPIRSDYCSGYDPTKLGTQTVKVSALGFTDTVKVTVDQHDVVTDGAVAATCTEDGLTEGSHCASCGEVLTRQQVIPALGHSYTSKVTAPTCAEEGYTTYTCSACGDSYMDDYINATGEHTYSNERDEACNVCGYTREVKIETTPMYRMYNPNSGEHFYTGSKEEREILRKAGWDYEGIGWYAPTKIGEPVYRMYNPNSGDHHYTMSWSGVEMLKGFGWKYEGVGWNSELSKYGDPLYRLYNPNADCGSHHYTNSEDERDFLIYVGWIYEGIGWYGVKK